MKKVILIFLLISTITVGQKFKVEKLGGKVLVQKGVEEDFILLKKGDFLSGNDLVLTQENSFIQLNKNDNRFLLNSNSALGLSYIRQVSINDLLLALAMEDIRNIPKNKNNGIEKNTAVYGKKVTGSLAKTLSKNKLGKMKINGAKQLAESGFTESAIIVSKDTFRKYPETKNNFDDRLYFANLLDELQLYNEALDEFKSIKALKLNSKQTSEVNKKIEAVSMKLVSK